MEISNRKEEVIEKLPEEYKKPSGLFINQIVSLDPGFQNMAALRVNLRIDTNRREVEIKILNAVLAPCTSYNHNIIEFARILDNWLKVYIFDKVPSNDHFNLLFLMEKQYTNYHYTPSNPYAFTRSVELTSLQNLLYTLITFNYKAFVELIPSNEVKKFFNSGTGNHRQNKLKAIDITKELCATFVNGEQLEKELLQLDTLQDNHLADCFVQLIYWIKKLILSGQLNPYKTPNLKNWKWTFLSNNTGEK